MTIRTTWLGAALACLLALGGCGEPKSGPIVVSAIGGEPALLNPNLKELSPASSALLLATAQGLVRFDPAGQIEPALAQSWIVSDDGLRYTFRLARTEWSDGSEVTARQVVERLQAAMSDASENPLKPLLGIVDEVEAMTDEVLEISLKTPRPDFLQLLAQPEMAILRDGVGTGPLHAVANAEGYISLHRPEDEDESDTEEAEPVEEDTHDTAIILRGERAALAVARFMANYADLVTGGTAGDLPIVRAAKPDNDALRFDPVAGMFGLAFVEKSGLFANPEARRALSMAVNRADVVEALAVPDLQPRETLLPLGIDEQPAPAAPDWAQTPLPMRRTQAARLIADAADGAPVTVRVAMPQGLGYRLLFAYLARDWRAIGVTAERVPLDDRSADLRLIDEVAPIDLASWYLRHFTCDRRFVCDPSADEMLAAARIAPTIDNRRALLANADRIMTDLAPFIPLTAPVRWSLVSPRLTGFATNIFGRHGIDELVAPTP